MSAHENETGRGQDAERDVQAPDGGSWRDWVEPWYLAYALEGMAIAGLVPILLPLEVHPTGGPAHVGLVMAAVSLGGVSAPLWGRLADGRNLHRWLLAGGLLAMAVAIGLFPFATSLPAWLALGLLQGAGAVAAGTVANMFVVEAHPEEEWDRRLGWLQTFYGAGQVAGLLVAGALSGAGTDVGLWIAAGLGAFGATLGFVMTRGRVDRTRLDPAPAQPAGSGEWAPGSPQHCAHTVTGKAWDALRAIARAPFGRFLVVWMVAFIGSSAVFSLYPVLMQNLFGVDPAVSSPLYAVAAGIGLLLYAPAGRWSDRFGAVPLLRVALGLRVLALAVLFALGLVHLGCAWLALGAFGVVALTWSLLSVTGTALTARLTPVGEGEGMGLFNAVGDLATVIGSVLGGWLVAWLGYAAAPGQAVAGVGAGLLLTLLLSAASVKGDTGGSESSS